MKKVKFIYNPFSGEKEILKYLDYIIKEYQNKSYSINPYRISHGSNLEEAFYDMDDSYDHILISGGDGTINDVVNIMKNKNIDLPVAILPAGTANDFAGVIGMPIDIKKSINHILNSSIKTVDLGKANDKYFVNIFSCGLFTDVSQKTPTEHKNIFGKLAYYYTGLKELPKFKMLNLSIKSDEFNFEGQSILFFIFNGKTAGNFQISYDSEIDDGLLNMIVVSPENILETISSLPNFLMKKNFTFPSGVIHHKVKELEIDILNDGNYTTDVDGEPGPSFPIRITCIKNGLKILR